HRRHTAVRRDPRRLPRRALSGSLAAVVSRARADRRLAQSAPASVRADRALESGAGSAVSRDAVAVRHDERPIPAERTVFNDGLCMGVDLSGRLTEGIIGYRAHPNPPAVDLSRIGFYDPAEFWEPIKRPSRDAYILEANRFY